MAEVDFYDSKSNVQKFGERLLYNYDVEQGKMKGWERVH